MTEQRITFETAVLAKEKGFDIDSKYYISKKKTSQYMFDSKQSISVKLLHQPTQALLQKWLREVHGIDILFKRTFSNGIKQYILTPCFDKPTSKVYNRVKENNYEQALELALQEALKLIP